MSSIDVFRIFKSCFFCKRKNGLLRRTEQSGYNTTFHYYHEECRKKVLKDPEIHVLYLDQAIQITDDIERERQDMENRERRNQELILRAKQLNEVEQPPGLAKYLINEGLNLEKEKYEEIEEDSKLTKMEKMFK